MHGYTLLEFDSHETPQRLTHQLFRYPAKFHAPAARALLHRYTVPGDLVLDPFCGSGTLLVEAAVTGRAGIGLDLDPVATFVSKVKTKRYQVKTMVEYLALIEAALGDFERTDYQALMFEDISNEEYNSAKQDQLLWVPAIPNIGHWFRRYVIVDLARILHTIDTVGSKGKYRDFFRLVFLSIIRNSSNADPVPVSGLEVTSHMLKREAMGRLINPFELFRRAARKAAVAALEFSAVLKLAPRVFNGDALRMTGRRHIQDIDAVITSPPYNSAVDYYRRHTLEMYWLRVVANHNDRLELKPHYIGQDRVPLNSPLLRLPWSPGPETSAVASRMAEVSPRRSLNLRAYVSALEAWFDQVHQVTRPGAPVIVVVGQSSWADEQIRTEVLLREAAGTRFELSEVMFYPVKNRYMSYQRRNGADIKVEIVVALKTM